MKEKEEELTKTSQEEETQEKTSEEPQESEVSIYEGDIERFKGKTMDEIAGSYKELESEHSRRMNELGTAKQERDAYKNWYDLNQNKPATQQAENFDDQFIDSPTKTVNTMLDKRLGEMEQRMVYQGAMQNATVAKMQAKQMNPVLFEGIDESKLDQLVYGGIQSGTIAPQVASDPNGWLMTAWQLKGQEAGFKFKPTSPPAVVPDADLPPAVKGSDKPSPGKLSGTSKEIFDGWGEGFKEEDIAEGVAEERRDRRGEE